MPIFAISEMCDVAYLTLALVVKSLPFMVRYRTKCFLCPGFLKNQSHKV